MTSKNKRYIHTEDVHNFKAASVLVPFIVNLINPKSVLDVGCGTGTWLKVFQDHGIEDICGLDGDYVDKSTLCISPAKFISSDLRNTINLERKFDVVLCLEVAEHIEAEHAADLINTLDNHGDTILFSAALPFQGGQNHINEQPPQYWYMRFESFGYKFIDIIRPLFWQNEQIDWWYRQNIFLVTKNRMLIDSLHSSIGNNMYIHPELYKIKVQHLREWEEAQHSPQEYLNLLIKSTIKKFNKKK